MTQIVLALVFGMLVAPYILTRTMPGYSGGT
jgi:hypothetical protein